jgi:N-methylhydantoinase A
MTLDRAKSEQAVSRIADALGMNVFEAASGIIAVVNDHMVRALRVMSVQRGEDPRDYTLVSFGGAGGLHVCALADALGMQRALVPVNAGVLSALGMLAAEPSRERSRTLRRLLADCDAAALEREFAELEALATDELREIAGENGIVASYSVDLRYRGQSYTLNLDWDSPAILEQEFHALHESRYGHRMEIPVELVNLRVRVLGQRPPFELPLWVPDAAGAGVRTRRPGRRARARRAGAGHRNHRDDLDRQRLAGEGGCLGQPAAGLSLKREDRIPVSPAPEPFIESS